MALLKSIASGNFTAASTWAVCSAVNDASTGITTTTTAYVVSGTSFTFTGGASQICTGILLKFGTRASTVSGTISVQLYLSNGTTIVLDAGGANAEVTMNAVDVLSSSLPTSGSTSIYGHWVFFKFKDTVTLTNGTGYRVGVKSSVLGVAGVHRGASAGVWASALVTDVTQAPAATDKFIVVGDNLAAATTANAGTKAASYTVTMDNTATTQFGAAETGNAIWGLYVGDQGKLSFGTAASTNYFLRVRGNIGVGSGGDSFKGSLEIGSVANPIPRTSTAILEIDSATVGAHFISVQGGKFIAQGLSRTSGKEVDKCLLSADSAASATTLQVDTDTGWLSGDTFWVGPTGRVAGTGGEERTLSGNAGASSITLSAGMTAAREGNAVIRAALMLTTRNVIIRSTGAALQCWMETKGSTSEVDFDWVKLELIGSATTSKNGWYLDGTVSQISFDRCNFNRCYLALLSTTANGGGLVSNCTFTQSAAFSFLAVSSATTLTNNWVASTTSTFNAMIFRDPNFTISGLRVVSSTAAGLAFSAVQGVFSATAGSWSDILIHSSTTGMSFTAQDFGQLNLSNVEIQRCSTQGIALAGAAGVILDNFKVYGNASRNIIISGGHGEVIFRNSFFGGQDSVAPNADNATTNGVEFSGLSGSRVVFENCKFSTGFSNALAHTGNDILFGTGFGGIVLLRNCTLAATAEVSALSLDTSLVASENHDESAGARKIWKKRGIIASDTTITRSGTVSLRLTPNSSSFKLDYVFARVAVASGSAPTVGVYVRKSVAGDGTAYNGAQPRLIVRRNILVGLTSDLVLATASGSAGSWELLSGTLPTLTGNGVIEVEVDCDGTAGWVNMADFQAPAPVNSKGFAFIDETLGVAAYGDNSAGGGGGSSATVGYAFVG